MTIEDKEVIALTKFTKTEIEKLNNMLTYLVKNNFKFLNQKQEEEFKHNLNEVKEFLPQIETTYLNQMIEPLKITKRLQYDLMAKNPTNANIQALSQNIESIDNFFERFQLSKEPSLPPGLSDEDRNLYQRVLNPYPNTDKDYHKMIQRMAKTALSTDESSPEWKNIAETLKSTYESSDTPTDPTIEAISELFLVGIKNLEAREENFQLGKQKIAELSNPKAVPVENRKQSKSKVDSLLQAIADNLVKENN